MDPTESRKQKHKGVLAVFFSGFVDDEIVDKEDVKWGCVF